MTTFERMKSRLLMQFQNKTIIEAFLETLAEELDLLKKVNDDLKALRWIDSAFGKQLDGCGDIVARPRLISKAVIVPYFGFLNHGNRTFGMARFRRLHETYLSSATLGDAEYRLILWAKVFVNTTDGTMESTIKSLVMLFRCAVTLVDAGNAKMRITIRRQLLEGEMTLISALNLIVRSGGVGIKFLQWQHEIDVLGFSRIDESDAGIFKGFGIGRFAMIITQNH